jgi:hypothetical protein
MLFGIRIVLVVEENDLESCMLVKGTKKRRISCHLKAVGLPIMATETAEMHSEFVIIQRLGLGM